MTGAAADRHPLGSAAWVEALDRALAARPTGGGREPPAELVVQQELVDDGTAWHVVAGAQGARAAAGNHPAPDVVLRWTRATAEGVNRGDDTALDAFGRGDLRLGGDVARLAEAARALGGVAPVPAAGPGPGPG